MTRTTSNTTDTPCCLQDLPQTTQLRELEVMLPDINGHLRGKVIQLDSRKNLRDYRLLFPFTSLVSDFVGDSITETGLVWETGDPDYPCTLELEHLAPIPWREGRAQVIMRIREPKGEPVAADGREVLRRLRDRFLAKNLTVSAAVELEFTLLPENNYHQMPTLLFSREHDNRPRLYDVEAAEEYQALFDAIQRAAMAQNLPADSLVTEAAPNQFEINLHHVDDPLLAADQAILLKRLIKNVAKSFHYRASFMAKPFAGYPGNGLHIHMSVRDQQSGNIFCSKNSNKPSSDALLHAVSGIQRTTQASQILLYPNANSFKRIAPNSYAPRSTHWGYNNRSVAIRIPGGDAEARRIEHRLAGADANPYLVMSALMMGIDYGLENPALPSKETVGDLLSGEGIFLYQDADQAQEAFTQSPVITEYFGAEFQRVYAICHSCEIARFRNRIMPIEYDWFFDTA